MDKPKPEFPKTVTVRGIPGIEAKVYRQDRIKGNQTYTSFIVGYVLLGKRKLESFSDLGRATAAAEGAIHKIANGEQAALELRNGDAYAYLRAKESLPPGVAIDFACGVYSDCIKALVGHGNPVEACREYAKRHSRITAKATVPDAVKEMIKQEEIQRNGKRRAAWVKLLRSHIENKFAEAFSVRVDEIEPSQINAWLAGLDCAERTKKNIRDCLKHFFKWCRARGYLDKDTDLLADVQDFRKRKRGKIHTLTPDELSKLLKAVEAPLLPYIALRAFAGLRDSEATAIDWRNIDLDGGWIEITEEVAKASDDENGTRRLIPIRPCLKSWLTDHAKKAGRLCPFDNTSKQIAALCEAAGVTWKRNWPSRTISRW